MIKYIQINLMELAESVFPDFANEDSLNLEADDVDSIQANRRLDAFQERFLIDNVKVPKEAARIPKSKIDFLYQKVSNFANGECITGLFVHFACKEVAGSYVFTPLFQPVFLTLKDHDHFSLTEVYEITQYGKVYHFFEGEFVECQKTDSVDQELEWRNHYRSNRTTIKRASDINQPFSTFVHNADSESQLFPFQLIYTLLKHNKSEELIFRNCMSEFRTNPLMAFKHSMFLSASPQMGGEGAFYGKHANRSHLCPPCTSRFGFESN